MLGAGASKPFGFPTGSELRDEIIRLITEDQEAYELIQRAGAPPDWVGPLAQMLRYGDYRSVDHLLCDRSRLAHVAAMAISLIICRSEQDDRIFPPGSSDWYGLLGDVIDLGGGQYDKQRVSVVTFNYDRSLEYYIWRRFKARGVPEPRADVDLLSNFPVIHVHGSLGSLAPKAPDSIPFGAAINEPELLCEVSRRLRMVVGPAGQEGPAVEAARTALHEAKRVVFLGFGFHAANLYTLGLRKDGRWPELYGKDIALTTCGLSSHFVDGLLKNEFRDVKVERLAALAKDALEHLVRQGL